MSLPASVVVEAVAEVVVADEAPLLLETCDEWDLQWVVHLLTAAVAAATVVVMAAALVAMAAAQVVAMVVATAAEAMEVVATATLVVLVAHHPGGKRLLDAEDERPLPSALSTNFQFSFREDFDKPCAGLAHWLPKTIRLYDEIIQQF